MARKNQILANMKKQNGGKRSVHKKSDFSMNRLPQHPNQTRQHRHNNSQRAAAAASGSPSRYLVGKSTAPSSKHTKRKGMQLKGKKGGGGGPQPSLSKKNKYEAKLPIVDGNSRPVPWWRKEVSQQITSQSHHHQQRKENHRPVARLLNGALTANESALHHLNAELEEFGKYVRLSAVEQDARMFLISRIRQICQQLFGIEASQCQVFGSFAAPDVCIFESDIDLAIWGVVAPDDDDDDDNGPQRISIHRKRSISLADDSLPAGEDDEKTTAAQPPPEHPNRKKQEKVQRWINAIDGGLLARESLGQKEQAIDKDSKAGEAKEELLTFDREEQATKPSSEEPQASYVQQQEESTKTQNAVVDSLFVLDRIGIIDENPTKSDPDTELSVSKQDQHDSLNAEEEISDNGSKQDRSDSEDDDADKLESLRYRTLRADEFRRSRSMDDRFHAEDGGKDNDGGSSVGDVNQEDETSDSESSEPVRRRSRAQSMISLSSATTCSDNEKFDGSGMEVSFMVDRSQQRRSKKVVGPTGRARTMVVNALYKITRHLRPYAATLHVRKKAKVPIINLSSHFGFECDIAMGGHNGTDTSSYASAQVARFKSFPVVVVVLKILLSQHGLDKPFTGGLGSFSLYVLVANHLECHLADGGNDDPAEALVTFLFRYGAVRHSNSRISAASRTQLHQQMVVATSDGGSTDMGCCYQVESIVGLFNVCYFALYKRLTSNMNGKYSILQYILDAEKLEIGRGRYKQQANNKLNQFTGGSDFRGSTSFVNIRAPQTENRNKMTATDAEAEMLIKSYNQDVAAFMPPTRANKRKQETIDDLFAPVEVPTRAKKTKQGGKKKGKNKRRKTI